MGVVRLSGFSPITADHNVMRRGSNPPLMALDSTVRLEELTWTEVDDALDGDVRTAVVAVGSVEQHGPHLPLVMDTLAGDAVAERVARELGDALAAPTIRPGCSGHHMAFPGTITVSAETLMDTIRAYVRSLDEHGFEDVALVPTHGGNFGPRSPRGRWPSRRRRRG